MYHFFHQKSFITKKREKRSVHLGIVLSDEVGLYPCTSFWGFPGSSAGKESACNAGDPSSIPGSGRSPGEGNGNPYSGLENSMDRGACQATVHGVTKRQTPLSDFYFHKIFILLWFSDNKFENVGHFQ